MGKISKSFALFCILIMVFSSLSALMIKPVFAQSISTPSVPQFTVKFVSSSYSVTTTNPYSGQSMTKQYENNTIQVTIKNQPIPTTFVGNNSVNLYYNVQTKGHFGQNWIDQYSFPNWASSSSDSLSGSYSNVLPTQSGSEYTVLSFPANYQTGNEIDFQVEALLAYQITTETYQGGIIVPIPETSFTYQSSGWSATQIFTMPNTFLMDNLTYIIVVVAIVALLGAVIALLLFRMHQKTTKPNQ